MPDAGRTTEDPVFYADLAEGPDTARAWWVTASDGTRLRVVTWAGGDAGTVLIFPGRNDHVERYGRVARMLADRGLSSAAIDWRGQGMSARAPGVGNAGHVTTFEEYQRDTRAYLAAVREAGLPDPYYLLGHSMGGAIGLGALGNGLPVRAATFSAPMWGICFPPRLRRVAPLLPRLAVAAGLGLATVPRGPRESYFLVQPFEGNFLTSDSDTYAWLTAHAARDTRLALGRPTYAWLAAGLREIGRFATQPPPEVPVLVGLAGADTVVDNAAIARLAGRWREVKIETYPGARHELMMERAEVRDRFLDAAVRHFESAG